MSAAGIQETSARTQSDADAELAIVASSGAASGALRAGARAPLFVLANANGQKVALDELLRAGPVVLQFFRGPWCSFGEESLAEFVSASHDVVELGASAVAIGSFSKSPASRAHMQICELEDIDMKVACAYGLAFDLPVGLRPRYEALGYVPPPAGKTDAWLVPLPATYLLDRDGIIVLAFIDVDYRRHFETASLLAALRALQGRHASHRPHLRSERL
jgi:peroxiredoxin